MAEQESAHKRVAIYCRVSTDEQAKEGVSLDEQRTRLTAYCVAMGWTVEIVEYIDDGYSAKNMQRPALARLLCDVKNGTISKLMVTKLDRLSRRLLDLLTLIELFHHHHIAFVSTSEAFDTDTPSGRLTLQVLGAVAEFERERIRERVVENMLHASKSGKWLTQHPYGYRLEQKQLVMYEPEALIVRRIFALFVDQGLGYFAIAKWLNDQNIPSRQNKEWSLRAVKLLLTNPAYCGTLVWNRVDSSTKKRRVRDEEEWIVIPHSHPAIIDQDVWDQVQQRVNKVRTTAPRAKTSPHLLGGLLRCGQCGATMSIGWSGWPKRHRVYRCSGYTNKGTCQSKPYRADDVEAWFMQGLIQLFEAIDNSALQVELHLAMTAKQDNERRMEAAKRRYHRQVEAYTAGLIELGDLAKEKEALEQAMIVSDKVPEQPLQDLQYAAIEREAMASAQDVASAVEGLPIADAKAKLQTLIDRVVILAYENIEISLRL